MCHPIISFTKSYFRINLLFWFSLKQNKIQNLKIFFYPSFCLFFFLLNKNKISGQESLYAAPAATMYTHTGAEVGIFGNIINDAAGGLNHNNGGTVYIFRNAGTGTGNSRIYDGPSAPAFTGNYNTGGAFVRFYNLVTDNSIGTNTSSGTLINTNSGQGQIQVEQEIRISNLHTFTNGMIWTPRGNWKHAYVHYDANGASYSGNSNTKHIDGYVAKTGSSDFDFPIGDGIRQRISGLSSPASGTYKSAYFKQNPQSGTIGISGSSTAASPMLGALVKISTREFWDIDGTAASQYKLTALNTVAGYSDWANDFVTFLPADIKIAAWDGAWENLSINSTPASLNADGPFISAAVPTNPDIGNAWGSGQPFSAYTWGVSVFPVPLTLKLLSFTAIAGECAANLYWTTSNEVNADRFEMEQSNDGINFSIAGIINAKNGTGTNNYFITINQQEKTKYYRLKIIDHNGQFTYSPVQIVRTNCGQAASYINVFPNPVRNGFVFISFISDKTGNANLLLVNKTGQLVIKKNLPVTAGGNIIKLEMNQLSKGIYIIQLSYADGKMIAQSQKIILE